MKSLISLIIGALLGVGGTVYTIKWQDEHLTYEISSPARFGKITYQNLRISNDGWNPAKNVKVFLRGRHLSADGIKESPSFNLKDDSPDIVGGYDRIRRGETATVTFAFKGKPISHDDLLVESDRSIAVLRSPGSQGFVSWPSFFLGMGALFLSSVLAGIVVPAYRSYMETARLAAEREQAASGGGHDRGES